MSGQWGTQVPCGRGLDMRHRRGPCPGRLSWPQTRSASKGQVAQGHDSLTPTPAGGAPAANITGECEVKETSLSPRGTEQL